MKNCVSADDASIVSVMENLVKNRMQAHFVSTKEEVPALVESLIKPGDIVAVGGSVSLHESGVIERLRSGRYRFLDRSAPGLTPAEKQEVQKQTFGADVFLCSTNAVTLRGELYNVDGFGNRIAAMCYGPASVILVVGCNKIVADLPAAIRRVKEISAPRNAQRLGRHTFCAAKGCCLERDGRYCTDGCGTEDRICSSYMILGRQLVKDRIKVLLVGEPLGL